MQAVSKVFFNWWSERTSEVQYLFWKLTFLAFSLRFNFNSVRRGLSTGLDCRAKTSQCCITCTHRKEMERCWIQDFCFHKYCSASQNSDYFFLLYEAIKIYFLNFDEFEKSIKCLFVSQGQWISVITHTDSLHERSLFFLTVVIGLSDNCKMWQPLVSWALGHPNLKQYQPKIIPIWDNTTP